MDPVVRGLDDILAEDWRDLPPTKKQLDWVEDWMGKGVLRIIRMQNWGRGEVHDFIQEEIARMDKEFEEWGEYTW